MLRGHISTEETWGFGRLYSLSRISPKPKTRTMRRMIRRFAVSEGPVPLTQASNVFGEQTA
jgi:hypothetical protein